MCDSAADAELRPQRRGRQQAAAAAQQKQQQLTQRSEQHDGRSINRSSGIGAAHHDTHVRVRVRGGSDELADGGYGDAIERGREGFGRGAHNGVAGELGEPKTGRS